MVENTQTKMYLIYIDESYDEESFVYSAMFIDAFNWNDYLEHILKWRREWFDTHQISLDYELHATKFVGGRGEYPANRNKAYRAELFYEAIGRVEKIKNIKIINAFTANKQNHLTLFEYMLNRIHRTLEADNAYGVLICDEGNENKLTSIVRRMKKESVIPHNEYHRENYGYGTRKIKLDRIIEDPLFKTSKSSYFIQLVDFIAFSLLKNEKPVEGSTLEKVKTAFEQLDTSLTKEAFGKDPKSKGIIRI